ncbi:hypothetical protein, partial [Candidatus Cyrtobacter comes]|uniref:hypothetical protein n=1 Tax=Candidatus Cyrtobacter comes TaxID=675776 RepID=UPI002ACEBC9D
LGNEDLDKLEGLLQKYGDSLLAFLFKDSENIQNAVTLGEHALAEEMKKFNTPVHGFVLG